MILAKYVFCNRHCIVNATAELLRGFACIEIWYCWNDMETLHDIQVDVYGIPFFEIWIWILSRIECHWIALIKKEFTIKHVYQNVEFTMKL